MSRQVRRHIAALATAITFVCAPSVYSQATTSLRGTISDPLGAVIPEAIVTLTNTGNSSARQVVTDKTGLYQFQQLPPGNYKITVEKPGFAKVSENNVTLLVNTPATLDLKMEVGQTSDT